ncbi:hypothetical protein [Variovorax sp. Sphag1AA]|uniref:hypothetical protein n=1 Tax=Variovorax sp. Sphag1AA TaxID=2587027 RepID=UPI0016182D0F|nr:hypothetical protein [Variovorax sp. Sphag1AA]MBB3181980.1 hypothetical protein [Variovorax sp. Sphag1AA]
MALNLSGSSIGATLSLGPRLTVLGRVVYIGGTVGGNIEFEGSRILARRGDALCIERVRTQGSVLLRREFAQDVQPGRTAQMRRFRVRGGVRLFGSSIDGNLSLRGAWMLGGGRDALQATGLRVGNSVHMDDDLFAQGSVLLQRAVIGNDLDLRSSRIDAQGTALSLQGTRIGGTLYLDAGFRIEKGGLDLSDASVARFQDAEGGWPTKGWLNALGFVYGLIDPPDAPIRLRWLDLQPPLVAAAVRKDGHAPAFHAQPHEQLAQVLRRAGHERDARRVAIAKEDALHSAGAYRGAARWWHSFYGQTLRYGYQPQRSLLFTPLIIAGFALALAAGGHELMVPTKPEAAAQFFEHCQSPPNYPEFSPLIFALDTFIPSVNLHQKDSWRIDEHSRCLCHVLPVPAGVLKGWLAVHTLMGWLIAALTVAGFTGLVRKG